MIVPFHKAECAEIAFRKIDDLLSQGACEKCAIRLTANHFDVPYRELLVLYLDRDWNG